MAQVDHVVQAGAEQLGLLDRSDGFGRIGRLPRGASIESRPPGAPQSWHQFRSFRRASSATTCKPRYFHTPAAQVQDPTFRFFTDDGLSSPESTVLHGSSRRRPDGEMALPAAGPCRADHAAIGEYARMQALDGRQQRAGRGPGPGRLVSAAAEGEEFCCGASAYCKVRRATAHQSSRNDWSFVAVVGHAVDVKVAVLRSAAAVGIVREVDPYCVGPTGPGSRKDKSWLPPEL